MYVVLKLPLGYLGGLAIFQVPKIPGNLIQTAVRGNCPGDKAENRSGCQETVAGHGLPCEMEEEGHGAGRTTQGGQHNTTSSAGLLWHLLTKTRLAQVSMAAAYLHFSRSHANCVKPPVPLQVQHHLCQSGKN